MSRVKENLREIDALIKEAQWDLAQKRLNAIRRRLGEREDLLTFASLCRRAGIAAVGISVLRTLVRPTSRRAVSETTDSEKTEYAACLTQIGALGEARKLLASVKGEPSPARLRVLALLHVKDWDYPAAIPILRKTVNHSQTNSYEKTVGLLNLGMCLTFEEKLGEAASVLAEVLASREGEQYNLIRGNAYRLLGLIDYQKEKYSTAIQYFETAFAQFSKTDGLDRFLVQKWMAITNFVVNDRDAASQKKLFAIREESLKRKHWESVRDVDFQMALHNKDSQLLLKVYFGTPFERYRQRIIKKASYLKIPEFYQWRPSGEKGTDGVTFDLERAGLKGGQSLYRFLAILLSDFYRPFSTVQLFEALFPTEFYNHGDSEQKVYQIITRARRWLEDRELPLEIDPTSNESKLLETDPCVVIVRKEKGAKDQTDFRLKEIRRQLGTEFKAKQAYELLGISKRTLINVLNEAMENGTLIREGEGIKTIYRFVEEAKKAS